MTSFPEHRDRATDEAAHWLVALEDDPGNPDLRARFETWLTAHPENAAAWADTTDVYAMMTETEPVHAERWRSRPRPAVAKAAALALAAGLAFALLPGMMTYLRADQTTATAEVRAVRLEDGSMVHLGPGSALDVAFAGGERRVRLLDGEAFFEVVPDPDRPFRVEAGGTEATVLGTAFDVRLGSGGTTVAVRHGRVRVDGGPASERLEAGDWVRMGSGGTAERGVVPPAEVASWLGGQIVARDRPVAEVVDELRRYHSGVIVLADDALGARRVTGVYNVADPRAALRAVAGAHGATVRSLTPWVLLVSAGSPLAP
jgi:Fe2+-dicitrate sensor, membrane component